MLLLWKKILFHNIMYSIQPIKCRLLLGFFYGQDERNNNLTIPTTVDWGICDLRHMILNIGISYKIQQLINLHV